MGKVVLKNLTWENCVCFKICSHVNSLTRHICHGFFSLDDSPLMGGSLPYDTLCTRNYHMWLCRLSWMDTHALLGLSLTHTYTHPHTHTHIHTHTLLYLFPAPSLPPASRLNVGINQLGKNALTRLESVLFTIHL